MKTVQKNRYHQKINRLSFFNSQEIAELPKLILPGETIHAIIGGFYTAGSAILCVTSRRLLLVDKKLIRLSFEDIHFESIKEVNYAQQAFLASLKFYYAGRSLQFRSWYKGDLRIVAHMIQERMYELRENANAPKIDLTAIEQTAATTPAQQPYGTSPEMEAYLKERIARWRRASKFLDSIPAKQ